MALLAVVGVAVWEPAQARFGTARTLLAVCGLAIAVLEPGIVLASVVGGLMLVAGRRQMNKRAHALVAERDLAVFSRSLYVAVNAGLSLTGALGVASDDMGDQISDEVAALMRRTRKDGLAVALADSSGASGRLFTVLARAHTTGASVGDAIGGFVEERREAHRLRVVEAARRLPVKLTVPLALLILPGFVVLTVGPSVLESARRLLGPVVPIP